MIKYIFLLTDFGLKDPYVSQIKMVILSEADVNIVDISHEVSSFSILEGAFFLKSSWSYIPSKSITLVVIDPGVGSERKVIVSKDKRDRYIIAPDNGLISWVLDTIEEIWCVNLTLFDKVSSTFHGRDVFANLAVKIIKKEADPFLTKISKKDVITIERSEPVVEGNKLKTKVIHIDKFGNCVLSIPSSWKEKLKSRKIEMIYPLKQEIYFVKTYAYIPKGKIGILDGSQGFLELAVNMGSCKELLRLKVEDQCEFVLK